MSPVCPTALCRSPLCAHFQTPPIPPLPSSSGHGYQLRLSPNRASGAECATTRSHPSLLRCRSPATTIIELTSIHRSSPCTLQRRTSANSHRWPDQLPRQAVKVKDRQKPAACAITRGIGGQVCPHQPVATSGRWRRLAYRCQNDWSRRSRGSHCPAARFSGEMRGVQAPCHPSQPGSAPDEEGRYTDQDDQKIELEQQSVPAVTCTCRQ